VSIGVLLPLTAVWWTFQTYFLCDNYKVYIVQRHTRQPPVHLPPTTGRLGCLFAKSHISTVATITNMYRRPARASDHHSFQNPNIHVCIYILSDFTGIHMIQYGIFMAFLGTGVTQTVTSGMRISDSEWKSYAWVTSEQNWHPSMNHSWSIRRKFTESEHSDKRVAVSLMPLWVCLTK